MNLINTRNTRNNSILDHFYTNRVDKIERIEQDDDSFSDHSIMEITRKMKMSQTEEKLIQTRNYKIIDYDLINLNIINNEKYIRLLQEEDIDYITENLVSILNSELESQSKLRKIKIEEKNEKTFSEETIHLINIKK